MTTTGEYCRAVEAYLCKTNGGHLVRIVGPSFDRVCGWEARGIPLRVVYRGIDHAVERQRAKGKSSRRPLLIDFCEADVLDVFDEWRRATGVSMTSAPAADAADGEAGPAVTQAEPRRTPSLSAHLDRVIARLTSRRAGGVGPLDPQLDDIVRELDGIRAAGRALRGDARAAVIVRLAELDRTLLGAAWTLVDEPARAALREDADRELAPFRTRMAPEAYQRALDASMDRLLRDRERLPVVTFDA